jgi:hypothetical protein
MKGCFAPTGKDASLNMRIEISLKLEIITSFIKYWQ